VSRDKETDKPVATIEPFFDPDGRGGGLVYTRRWQAGP
jgi:hypothetical protein